jgi:Trypsin
MRSRLALHQFRPVARAPLWVWAAVFSALVASGALPQPASAIVGGRPVSIESAPWTVAIFGTNPSVSPSTPPSVLVCTGAVLDARHVATAAHCLYLSGAKPFPASRFLIRAGVSNYLTAHPSDALQERSVSSYRIHPGFREKDQGRFVGPPDDVAVLTLAQPLDVSGRDVQAIRLARTNTRFPVGQTVRLAAFGRESEARPPDGTLQDMEAKVSPRGVCGLPSFQGVPTLLAFNSIELCARSPSSTSCYADSGAGLVSAGPRPVLLGILDGSPFGGCAVGQETQFAFVAVPEIGWFLRGNAHPPKAPLVLAVLTLPASLRVGHSVLCQPEDRPGTRTRLRYTFLTSSGRIRQVGTKQAYTLRRADVGTRIVCQITASSPYGTSVGQLATDVVRP